MLEFFRHLKYVGVEGNLIFKIFLRIKEKLLQIDYEQFRVEGNLNFKIFLRIREKLQIDYEQTEFSRLCLDTSGIVFFKIFYLTWWSKRFVLLAQQLDILVEH